MLQAILLALIAIVVVFAGIVAMRPSEFHVARTTTISAPSSTVFAHVNDCHKWETWNPWVKIDPALADYPAPLLGGGR
jgi:hypothetical protein